MAEAEALDGQRSSSFTPEVAPASRAGGPNALSPEQAKATLQQLRELSVSPADCAVEMDHLTKLLRESDYRSETTQVLQEALATSNPNPHVGALWIRRVVTSKTWDRSYPKVLEELCRRGELGRRAVLEFVAYVGKKKRHKLVLKALHRHGEWLRTHERGWPVMARALSDSGCYSQAVRWTREWRKNNAPDFEVLYARAASLRGLGRNRTAKPVVEAALSRNGPALESAELRVWHALELALAGEIVEADSQLKSLKPVGWDDDVLCLFYLVRGLVRVKQAARADKKDAFAAAYGRILDRFRGLKVYRRSWVLRRDFRRCVWRMGVEAGRYGPALLAPWRSADTLWMPAILLLVPGLQFFLPVYLLHLWSRRQAKSTFFG
jgi:hypothetical protein